MSDLLRTQVQLPLRRFGVAQFRPEYTTDGPEPEFWGIEQGVAEKIAEEAHERRMTPERIVLAAVRDYFGLPDGVGNEPFVLVTDPPPRLIIDRNHDLRHVLTAVAEAHGTRRTAVLDSCLRTYCEPPNPEVPPRGPGTGSRMRVMHPLQRLAQLPQRVA